MSGFSKAKRRVDTLSAVSDWGLHDLRRSFATHLTQELGVSPVVADKILNHQSGAVRGIAAVYQRGQYLDQRRDAMERWGEWIIDFQNQQTSVNSARPSCGLAELPNRTGRTS